MGRDRLRRPVPAGQTALKLSEEIGGGDGYNVMQIEPKEDLKRRSGKSPDFAEAFVLTFTPQPPEKAMRLL